MYKKKSRLDIKKQLLAAICMLLISSLMMVTSTYAWFTLSTAPEVKGIQTSVGANGNLEIALLSTVDSLESPNGITSNVGDSSAATGKSALTANITWGNLVDLSHESYGLNFIKLLPAALDEDPDAPGYISRNFLSVPTYGADGRVNELTADGTQSGLYDTAMKSFVVPNLDATDTNYSATKAFGLRGVGVSTNQTVRDMAYNSALNAASSAALKFKQAANTSLMANGGGLANLASKKDGATITATDVEVLWKIFDNILGTRVYVEEGEEGKKVKVWNGARNADGIIHLGEEMVASYVAAAFASELNETEYTSDEQFTAALEALKDSDTDDVLATIGWETTGKLNELSAAVASLRENVENAETNLKAVNAEDGYTWAEINGVVSDLFSNMDVWDKSISDLKNMAQDNPNEIMALMTQYGKIIANIKGGVYADMAAITGSFSAEVNMDFTALTGYNGFENTPVLLNAKTTVIPSKNAAATAALTGRKYEGESTSSTTAISDTYGYIVDMAFRTNASNSNLLLQTAAEKRVNTSGTGAEAGATDPIMGGGSCMKFRLADIQADFGEDKILSLLNHVTVVFFIPSLDEAQPIIGYAKFDTKNPVKDAEYLTVNLYMIGDVVTEVDGVATTTKGLIKDQASAIITSMPSNTAVPISMLVYLDGNTIQNGDVATGALSMAGTLNVQFSSSAELVPMNYTAGYGAANEPTEPTATESAPAEPTEASTPESSDPVEGA